MAAPYAKSVNARKPETERLGFLAFLEPRRLVAGSKVILPTLLSEYSLKNFTISGQNPIRLIGFDITFSALYNLA